MKKSRLVINSQFPLALNLALRIGALAPKSSISHKTFDFLAELEREEDTVAKGEGGVGHWRLKSRGETVWLDCVGDPLKFGMEITGGDYRL